MHKFSPQHAERLEQQERYALLPPRQTLERLGIRKGMVVADVGAGTGFFSRAAADLVGTEGKVFALDMSEEMLGHLRRNGVPANVDVLHSEEYRFPLPDDSVDAAFIAFVLHETPDRDRFLRELNRITRAAGRIVIVEWKKQNEEHGPAEEERLAAGDLERNLREYKILDRGDLNDSHYFFVAGSRKDA